MLALEKHQNKCMQAFLTIEIHPKKDLNLCFRCLLGFSYNKKCVALNAGEQYECKA